MKTPKLTQQRPQVGGTHPCSVNVFFFYSKIHNIAYKYQTIYKTAVLTYQQQSASLHERKPNSLQERRNHFNLAWPSQLSDVVLPSTELASTCYHCVTKIRI